MITNVKELKKKWSGHVPDSICEGRRPRTRCSVELVENFDISISTIDWRDIESREKR